MSREYKQRIEFRQPTTTTDDSGQVLRAYAETPANRRFAKVEQTGGDFKDQATADFTIALPFDTIIDSVLPGTTRIFWRDTGQILNVSAVQTDHSKRLPTVEITATLDL